MKLSFPLATASLVALLLTGCAEDVGGMLADQSDADKSGDNGDDADKTATDDPDDDPVSSRDAGGRIDGGGKGDAGKGDAKVVDPARDAKVTDPAIPDASVDKVDSSTPGPVVVIPDGPYTADGFASLAPAMGAALDPKGGNAVTPAAPSGWVWYDIEGTKCRDGSPSGMYVHYADSNSLAIYLEGGGACTSPDFCAYNPKNVNEVLSGDGQTLITSAGGATPGRQQPNGQGIFDLANKANPFGSWNMVYIPYCTGDVHFGTRTDVTVPNVAGKHQFVGYRNMEKYMSRLVPTFGEKVKRVVLTGASAGGFGASLNYSLVQDSFDKSHVVTLDDSGPSFPDAQLPPCMQKRWRELWGFKDSLPADCEECKQADGGGLGKMGTYLEKKHPNFRYGLISSMHDEVIRAFYAMGENNCSGFETASPVPAVFLSLPTETYRAGLTGVRAMYLDTGKFASYYMSGPFNSTYHQHIFRPRFYEAAQGTTTIAQWTTDFLAGKMVQVGP